MKEGTGAAVFGQSIRRRLSFPLGRYKRVSRLKYEGWNFNSGNTAVETPCNGTK
jgi:hypothetical protein